MKYFGSTSGLTTLAEDQTTPANGMVSYVTSSYNSGYQNGDIKGAFLSSTDTASLVGSTLLDDDFTTYADQAAAEAAGWFFGTDWQFDAANDSAIRTGTTYQNLAKTLSLTVGKTYSLSITRSIGPSISAFLDGNNFVTVVGENNFTFTYKGGVSTLQLGTNSATGDVQKVVVRLADEDRSVNNKGLIVNGTVTRSPVATGAELVRYSGFSASNYLEQPYNSDLDFGTGDFCFMGWVRSAGGSGEEPIIDRSDNVGATGIYIYQGNNGNIFARVGNGTAVDFSLGASTAGVWRFIAVLRVAGIVYCYSNGELAASFSRAGSIDTATNKATLFGRNFAGVGADITSLALLRISATAPTAEQIAKIYNDEKVLFQENAAATLYGTSDAVTALAHDSDTDLLHVGTSDGRSVFRGLERIQNTTTSVSKAISAAGGLIAEK